MPYYELLKDKEVMFTRLSQIFKTQNIHFKKKYIDYTVYVWNQDTRKYLSKLGIKEFTASPELSYEDNLKIFGKTHFQNILCGNLPMVFTRNCFGHLFGCEKCLNTNIKEINNDDKDMKYSIICKKDYRMIINNDPILNDYTKVDLKNANVSFRYITLNQDLKTIKSTIDVLKDKNYYKKLKIMKTWNKSYECNLFHSKK